ncbi:MAG: carbonic anhydrase/acetyltransferase isoleucine patch superfamily-like protein, partial [Mycobacterium sp.]|nr:carbonic anhydrase/acetyltransferase isoleucine patch superfamily-like protein [Mycobacterium sp.]
MPEPLILTVNGHSPQLHAEAWVAPNAALVGRISLGAKASIWYGATLRAEIEPIEIGDGSNVQDSVT